MVGGRIDVVTEGGDSPYDLGRESEQLSVGIDEPRHENRGGAPAMDQEYVGLLVRGALEHCGEWLVALSTAVGLVCLLAFSRQETLVPFSSLSQTQRKTRQRRRSILPSVP